MVLKRFAVVVCLLGLTGCGGKGDSPTAATPTPTTTRIISIVGDLSFGDLTVGTSATRPITIRNTGTGPLTVTGMTAPSGDAFAASWTSGQIPAGGAQDVQVRFSPIEARSYVGSLTVNGDQTGGLNTAPVNARGISATPPSTPTPTPSVADVEYVVTERRASLVTISNASSDTAQFAHVEVPWSFKFSGARAGQFLYVSAQNDFSSGCIRVQILRRGVEFRNTESCGAYVIATASGSY